jgi:hypothetical protein
VFTEGCIGGHIVARTIINRGVGWRFAKTRTPPRQEKGGGLGSHRVRGVERGLRLGNAWACQRFLLILPPPPALGEGGHRVLARSSWCPKANVLIHGVPTGAALTLKMRPLHSPEGREADARLRIS